ncbi:MAG: aminopeptidase [Pseudomonas sp.]
MRFRSLFLVVLSLLLSGCSSISFVHQAWQGQREVMRLSVPVVDLLENPETDPALKARLQLALEAREFASSQLGLPDNASYTRYSALPRPYVLWNLFITPELSMEPREHCYLLAGCVAYKGYFSKQRAREEAEQWRARGKDVYMAGIPAYSTLGWYDDPLLSSMLHWDDDYVAGLIFHELAHQQFYLRDETAFNESFASFVQQEGLRQWRASRGLAPPDEAGQRQQTEFVDLMLATRKRLEHLYASDQSDKEKLQGKAQAFAQLELDYRQWRDQRWNGSRRFDPFFAEPLNNASLLPFALYDQWIPAFEQLFANAEQDWQQFYRDVEALARLPHSEREQRLQALAACAAEPAC